MKSQIHPNIIRQLLFLAVILLLAIVIFRELNFLLLPLLGAITFYVLCRNWIITLIVKYKWKKSLAAMLIIACTLLLIVAPFAWLINFGYHRLQPIIANPNLVKEKLMIVADYIQQQFHINVISQEYLHNANIFLMSLGQSILGSTLNSIGVLAMMYFILYFLLVQTYAVEKGMRNNLPFKENNVQELISKSRSLIISNALGIPIVAIIQGIVGLIGYWIFGVQDFVLFGLLTAIASVVPVVGTMLVYVPLALYLLSMHHNWQGIGVGLWGFLIIGVVDNLARLLVQKHLSDVHPLVTIFGVMMGLNLFGFIGIIFGPILLSIFVLLIKIYIDEYGNSQLEEG
ncbi:MAG: hypothetical protein RLZZ118_1765 [Bacteroidota bacterium]|jgi:predicted PurR-regulated permease PerM